MAKYSQKLADEICHYIETGFYSISEICNVFNISRNTFYKWKETKAGFSEALDSAFAAFNDSLLATARASLRKKLEGYTATEERYLYAPSKSNPDELVLKSKIVKKKECLPDTQILKMVLDRFDRKSDKESVNETPPTIVYVQDEYTAEQLRILSRNKGESGGAKKDFNDVEDFKVATFADKSRALMKHDKEANMYIIKGASSEFIPPDKLR